MPVSDLTNYQNGVSSFGIPVIGGPIPASPGNYIFVNYGTGVDGGPLSANSIDTPYKTIAAAYAQARSNYDDVIVLCGNSTHVLTQMLTVDKNRVHFVGIDGTYGRQYGQNAKIAIGVTTATTDIAAILNLGTRNSFQNIKVISDNTLAQGLYAFVDGGEYLLLNNCEIYLSTQLSVTSAAHFVANGDSGQYNNCTFGSLAQALSGTVIHPAVLLTKGLAGTGLVCRDTVFQNCQLWTQASHTTSALVYSSTATDVERMLKFKSCEFVNNKAASATPAQAIALAATLTVGSIVVDPTCSVFNCTKLSTSTGVLVSGAAPNSGAGIAVNAA